MAIAEIDRETLLTTEEESQLSLVWRRFVRHRLAVVSGMILIFIISASLLAPWVAPYVPTSINRDENNRILRNAPSSFDHWMGTDDIGRDVLSRLLFAGRISLFIAFTVVALQETIGSLVGAVSGYYSGWLDSIIQRAVEFLITLPGLPLLLALSALLRDRQIPFLPVEWSSAVIIVIILVLTGWTGSTVLVRGVVLSLRTMDFAEAARALGMSDFRIIMRHMLPNALPPIIVSATLGLGAVIIIESALSFLGFGVQPPIPTWGNMLAEYQGNMWTRPEKVFFPGLAIFICTLSFNYVGDGLRDALDPRLKM